MYNLLVDGVQQPRMFSILQNPWSNDYDLVSSCRDLKRNSNWSTQNLKIAYKYDTDWFTCREYGERANTCLWLGKKAWISAVNEEKIEIETKWNVGLTSNYLLWWVK